MKKRKRPLFGQNGVITAFVAMMLVPVVVFTSTMTDIARFKMFASQASMAADTYGEAVLSGYDSLLKDLYGLFSVTQDRDALEELKAYADMVGYSFNTGATDAHAPYADADYEIGYEAIKGANLANNTVLMTQIGDFMKFRVVETFMNDLGELDFGAFFETMDRMKNINKDNEAVQKVSEIGEASGEILEKIYDFYTQLKLLKGYPDYIENQKNHVYNYGSKMAEIVNSAEYQKYLDFQIDEPAYNAAKAQRERNAKAEKEEDKVPLTQEQQDLLAKYSGYDDDAYISGVKGTLDNYSKTAYETKLNVDTRIHSHNVNKVIDKLVSTANEIENAIGDIMTKKAEAERAIANASPDAQAGLKNEVATLDKLQKLQGKFNAIANAQNSQANKTNNTNNVTSIQNQTTVLDTYKDKICNGTQPHGQVDWSVNVTITWWDFYSNAEYKAFYDSLVDLYGNSKSGEGSKSKGDRFQSDANNKTKEELAKISGAETTSARNIGSLSSQLDGSSGGEIPGILSMFENGMSFGKAAGTAVTTVVNDVVLVQYDFGMFSNRVTGLDEKDDGSAGAGTQTTEEDNKEYSLTNYEKNRDNNYLYGAEIEYLIGGRTSSAKNLEYTRNFICAFRMTMNMISTYTINEINNTIEAIAGAAEAAVAASVVAAAAAPLVRIAVSIALRIGVASIETVADWESLKDRDKVALIKMEMGDIESAAVTDFLGGFGEGQPGAGNGPSGGLELSYEDYIKVLLYLLVDQNTLLDRTSDLVALNVNLAEQRTDTLTTLNFKMGNTVTAVNSYCKAHIDMVIIPDHFLELFMENDTEGTQEKIEAIDDGYIKYSVIRGY